MDGDKLKILFTGGGTGGHVFPALATIETLMSMGDFQIFYVGGYQGIEKMLLPERKIPFGTIWISGFQRRFTLKNLVFPLKLGISLVQSRKILTSFNPQVVVGTGGYVTGPVVYMAARRGIPTLIQEQDSFPGVTTRLLAKYVNVICIADEDTKQWLKNVKGEIFLSGNPVRNSLRAIEKSQAVHSWGLDPALPVLLIFGGSQGAKSLNKAFESIGPSLLKVNKVQFLWQVGEKNYPEFRAKSIYWHPNIKIVPFIDNIGMAYSAADIVVCRAGAITLAELSIMKKPCILVPYPFAAAKHQEINARAIEKKGAALVVLEETGFAEVLLKKITRLLNNPELQLTMKKKWEVLSRPDAAVKIAKKIIELTKN
jgi:UDP-N-acetylglucosamine--N-acetylmuramyl-(pentapeptide) pyrophosphoryl-undecaprenol N-acetylglucosamine transferase